MEEVVSEEELYKEENPEDIEDFVFGSSSSLIPHFFCSRVLSLIDLLQVIPTRWTVGEGMDVVQIGPTCVSCIVRKVMDSSRETMVGRNSVVTVNNHVTVLSTFT